MNLIIKIQNNFIDKKNRLQKIIKSITKRLIQLILKIIFNKFVKFRYYIIYVYNFCVNRIYIYIF